MAPAHRPPPPWPPPLPRCPLRRLRPHPLAGLRRFLCRIQGSTLRLTAGNIITTTESAVAAASSSSSHRRHHGRGSGRCCIGGCDGMTNVLRVALSNGDSTARPSKLKTSPSTSSHRSQIASPLPSSPETGHPRRCHSRRRHPRRPAVLAAAVPAATVPDGPESVASSALRRLRPVVSSVVVHVALQSVVLSGSWLMKAQSTGDPQQLDFKCGRRVFEINPEHPIIKNLNVIYSDEDQKFNKEIIVGLIHSELLNLEEYNIHLIKILDGGSSSQEP